MMGFGFLAFGVDWHERVRVIYAGDDVTDEDAMQVDSKLLLKSVTNSGYINVSWY